MHGQSEETRWKEAWKRCNENPSWDSANEVAQQEATPQPQYPEDHSQQQQQQGSPDNGQVASDQITSQPEEEPSSPVQGFGLPEINVPNELWASVGLGVGMLGLGSARTQDATA